MGGVVSGCSALERPRRVPEPGGTPWPRQSSLALAALPTAPACARGHVRAIAHEWGLRGLADTAGMRATICRSARTPLPTR
jgi:hypothetical protein